MGAFFHFFSLWSGPIVGFFFLPSLFFFPSLFLLAEKERKKETAFDVFCRWSEVTRKVELWVQILELNENGEYCPVEVTPAKDVCTGGIFQLRQVRWHVQDFSSEQRRWEAERALFCVDRGMVSNLLSSLGTEYDLVSVESFCVW